MRRKSFAVAIVIAVAAAMSVGFVSISPQVIYGDDNRLDTYQVQDQSILQLADATVALIAKDYFRDNGVDGFKLKNLKYGIENGLCSDERFYEQPSVANCSGVLIGQDLVVTAGHCIRNLAECKKFNVVFNYRMADANTPPLSAIYEDVYSCIKIVQREFSETVDYAIIRLDRPVKKRSPVRLQQNLAQPGDELFVIGHPAGLPTKIADGAVVRASNSNYFTANLDTYDGNSGSAVFNARTHEVAGVLVRGSDDFVYNEARQCSVSNRCTVDGCKGEEVTHISYVVKALKSVLTSASD